MRVLGIESATATARVAVLADDHVLSECSASQPGGGHGEILLPLIERVLKEASVELAGLGLVALSIGPGSFTGLRVGLSVAKGLCLAAGLPVVGVPTLETLAHAACPSAERIWAALDARKGEVYAALFERSGSDFECVRETAVTSVDQFLGQLTAGSRVVGDVTELHRERLRRVLGDEEQWFSEPVGLGSAVARRGLARFQRAGAADLARLEPRYAQGPRAERTQAANY